MCLLLRVRLFGLVFKGHQKETHHVGGGSLKKDTPTTSTSDLCIDSLELPAALPWADPPQMLALVRHAPWSNKGYGIIFHRIEWQQVLHIPPEDVLKESKGA